VPTSGMGPEEAHTGREAWFAAKTT
jgi:hypothetical protein